MNDIMLKLFKSLVVSGNFATPASEKLYQVTLSCLGQDVAPLNNEFGCAESVNNVVFKAFGDYAGGDVSTNRMYLSIINNKKFIQAKAPIQGDIILSPTGYGNGAIPNGHVGIVLDGGKIASNNSKTGLFEQNFTMESWNHRYKEAGGYPVYYFRRLIA